LPIEGDAANSNKDAVDVSGERETKLLNEAHLTQKVGTSWDNRPIKRNSEPAWEKSCSYSLEHGEDEVAVVMFTAADNYSWLHGYNGANLAGIRHMLQVSINIPVEEQQPFKKYMQHAEGAPKCLGKTHHLLIAFDHSCEPIANIQ
jgi:hypothetical protein